MTDDQRDYHSVRAQEELARAAAAGTDDAQRSHRQLAALHLEQVGSPVVADSASALPG